MRRLLLALAALPLLAPPAGAQGVLGRIRAAAEREAGRAAERAAERAVHDAMAWARDALTCTLGDAGCAQRAEAAGRPVVFTDPEGTPLPEAEQPYAPAAEAAFPAGFALDGEWAREASTNDPNDGMRARVSGAEAVLTHVPPTAGPGWDAGDVLWREIDRATGTVRVRGSDGRYYAGRLTGDAGGRLQLDVFHNGAGSDQTWVIAPRLVRFPPPGARIAPVDARFALHALEVVKPQEAAGDEPYVQVVPLRGLIGEADLRQPRPPAPARLGRGDDYGTGGEVLDVDPRAGVVRFEGVRPFEVVGALVLVAEEDLTERADREAALRAVGDAVRLRFRRALSPARLPYDLGDHSPANVARVARDVLDRLRAELGGPEALALALRVWEEHVDGGPLGDVAGADDDLFSFNLLVAVHAPGYAAVDPGAYREGVFHVFDAPGGPLELYSTELTAGGVSGVLRLTGQAFQSLSTLFQSGLTSGYAQRAELVVVDGARGE